jgi:uncharacterized protein YpuA (DUF1002 family)
MDNFKLYKDEILDFLKELEEGNLDAFNIMKTATQLIKVIGGDEDWDKVSDAIANVYKELDNVKDKKRAEELKRKIGELYGPLY